MKSLSEDDIDRLTEKQAARYFDDVDREIKERKLNNQNTRSISTSDF